MRTSLVLTLIGDDKPGLVQQLADRILEAGANWEESRMSRLSGKFAGLLRVSVDSDQADTLSAALASTGVAGLTVVVERSGGRTAAVRTIGLELVGHDHPGIVRNIARVLAARHVNIEELETDTTSAPMSGETLFRARAVLSMPSAMSLDDLRGELEALAGELMVDLSLKDVEAAAP
ncbi:MAG TPA: ACT domain-containing protein [Vicinamibacterales bacterium]|nr:ACT domain-containing protein [Vicinamibacterales bacterium]